MLACLFEKAYLSHDSKEVLECPMTEVNDFCVKVVADQSIKKKIWPRMSLMSTIVVVPGK